MGRYALLIGNANYSAMDSLPQCEFDAKDLAALLQDKNIGAYDEVVVKHDCSRQDMEQTIWNFFSRLTEDDTALFYFSGHGKANREGLFLFSPTTHYNTLDLDALRVSWVYGRMHPESCKCKRILVILDCCDSGNAVDIGKKGKDSPSLVLDNLSEGVWVLTSSSADEVSRASDERLGEALHSIFTHFIIEGLKTGGADRDKNGIIDAEELHSFLSEKVTNVTEGSQNPRRGEFGVIKGRFPFAYNRHHLSADVPLWVYEPRNDEGDGVFTLLEQYMIIERAWNLLSDKLPVREQNREFFLKALKLLHLARSHGKSHIPDSFDIDRKISVVEQKLFEERTPAKFRLPMLKWCLVTFGEGFQPYTRFHLSKYLVTTQQFNMFINGDDGYSNERWWTNFDAALNWYHKNRTKIKPSESQNDFPHVDVNWYEANAFCNWLSYKTDQNIVLPDTSRRTFAVKGTPIDNLKDNETEYPWGAAFKKKNLGWCNIRGSRLHKTTSVRQYEHKLSKFGGEYSIFGLVDLVGNAWEWTSDWIDDPRKGPLVSTMGGSWRSRPRHVSTTYKRNVRPETSSPDLGFRLALIP